MADTTAIDNLGNVELTAVIDNVEKDTKVRNKGAILKINARVKKANKNRLNDISINKKRDRFRHLDKSTSGGKSGHMCQDGLNICGRHHKWYCCGACSKKFDTICHLHEHLRCNHKSGGSYHYDHYLRTAFPKYDSFCRYTQTDWCQDSPAKPDLVTFDSSWQLQDTTVHFSKENKEAAFNKEKQKQIRTKENSIYNKNDRNEAEVHLKESFVEASKQEYADGDVSDITDDYFENDDNDDNGSKMTETLVSAVRDEKVLNECIVATDHSQTSIVTCPTETIIHKQCTSSDSFERKLEETKVKDEIKTEREISWTSAITLITNHNNLESEKHNEEQNITLGDSLVNDGIKSNGNLNKERLVKSSQPKKERALKVDNTAPLKSIASKRKKEKLIKTLGEVVPRLFPKKVTDRQNCRCELCGARFCFKTGLLKHEQRKHFDKMMVKCSHCKIMFMRESDLLDHMGMVHKVEKDGVISGNLLHLEQQALLSLETVIVDNKSLVKLVSSSPKRGKKKKAEVLQQNAPHTCELCGYTMPRSKMDVHQRLHSGERPFICDICGKGLISQNKLQRHKLIHLDVKRHTCDQCGAGFQMKYKLQMHMHIHTGKKPYLCSICGAEFNHSANLATHTRCVHLQVKPYVCKECGGRYAKRSQLDDHVLSHSTERQYTCRYCGKSFKYYKGMRRHEKNHMEEHNYECAQCGMKFVRKDNLDKHIATHSELTFQCKSCKKMFGDLKSLQEHYTSHVSRKSYSCYLCHSQFTAINKYYMHMLSIHSVEKLEAKKMISDSHPLEIILSGLKHNQISLDPNLHIDAETCLSMTGPTQSHAGVESYQMMSGILGGHKNTLSVLTQVATENLRIHSQDISEDEKGGHLNPTINPLMTYERDNRTVVLDYPLRTIELENKNKSVVDSPQDSRNQSYTQTSRGNFANLLTNAAVTFHQPIIEHAIQQHIVFGINSNQALNSVNNLNSYINSRPAGAAGTTGSLPQHDQDALAGLRRLQDEANQNTRSRPEQHHRPTDGCIIQDLSLDVSHQGGRTLQEISLDGAHHDSAVVRYRRQHMY